MAKSDSVTGRPLRATFQERTTANILQGHRWLSNLDATRRAPGLGLRVSQNRRYVSPKFTRARILQPEARGRNYASSLAFIVMFAFSTFDTGQPLLAFSAAFWKAA